MNDDQGNCWHRHKCINCLVRGRNICFRYTDVQRCAPSVTQGVTPVQANLEDAQAVRDITRLAFRQDKELQAGINRTCDSSCNWVEMLLSPSHRVRDRLSFSPSTGSG